MTADPVLWRIEKYEAMGWSRTECHVLAHTKDDKGCPLYWGDVKTLLEKIGSHALVYDILVGLAPAGLLEYEEVGPLGETDGG